MSFISPIGGPGKGLFPAPIIIKARAAEAGIVKNGLCMLDFINASSTTEGATGSASYLVRLPDATNSASTWEGGYYIMGVAQEDIASTGGAEGDVMICGVTNMKVHTDTVAGSGLVVGTNATGVLCTGATNLKVIAIAKAADTSGVAPVWFEGVSGFGQDVVNNTAT